MLPTGTRWSVVFFHRSHIRQRKGHSRLASRSVATSSTSPARVRSGSTKAPFARHGSTAFFAGRRARIRRSSQAGGAPRARRPRGTARGIVGVFRPVGGRGCGVGPGGGRHALGAWNARRLAAGRAGKGEDKSRGPPPPDCNRRLGKTGIVSPVTCLT